MIEVSDINGRRTFLARAAIAYVTEGGPSSAWHGIRAFVRLFDGSTLEVRETAGELIDAMSKAALHD